MADEVAMWREKLVEAAAEYDETLMEKFFEDPDSISEEELITALRKATIDMSIVPACCGSSFKNKGVQFLLDAVMRYLPHLLTFLPQREQIQEAERKLNVSLMQKSLSLRPRVQDCDRPVRGTPRIPQGIFRTS